MNTSPAASTATPWGRFNPVPTVVWGPPPAGTFTIRLLPGSAMNTSPAVSTATLVGTFNPVPTVVWGPPPEGTSTTRLWAWSAMKTSGAGGGVVVTVVPVLVGSDTTTVIGA